MDPTGTPRCPRDGQALEAEDLQTSEGTRTVLVCRACLGVLFPAATLREHLGPQVGSMVAAAVADAPEGPTCPDCDGRMRTPVVQGVEVDLCAACRTIWLDRGEAGALDRQASVRLRRSPVAVLSDALTALGWVP